MKLVTKSMDMLRRFSRDERGSTTVEFIMMFPLLCWCLLATVSYFHAYRSQAVAVKATITLADMVSRETEYINGSYLNNMRNLLQFLTMSEVVPDFRLTVFRWNENKNNYQVRWSRKRGRESTLTTTQLNEMSNQLPIMEHNQRAILIETWSDYEPRFNYNLGLREFQFENSMVLTPRFSSQTCWNSDPNEDPARAKC